MPKRIVTILITILLALPLFVQLTTVRVSANHDPLMTSPVTFFNVIGRVTYKQLGRLVGNMQRVVGADDIIVTATSFLGGGQAYTTTTDPNGVYSFNIPAGWYKITVNDPSHTASFFAPPLHVENVNTHKAKHADFQGLLFHSF